MTNPNHVFTLMDVFDKKFPMNNLKKILNSYTDSPDPLYERVTLGDMAIINGVTEAWWCTRILPENARRDVLKTILPTLKRVVDKHSGLLLKNDAIELIETFISGESVLISDLRDCSDDCLYHATNSFGSVVSLILNAIYEDNYTDSILQAMYLLETGSYYDPKEKEYQVNDICAVFPPVKKINSTSH